MIFIYSVKTGAILHFAQKPTQPPAPRLPDHSLTNSNISSTYILSNTIKYHQISTPTYSFIHFKISYIPSISPIYNHLSISSILPQLNNSYITLHLITQYQTQFYPIPNTILFLMLFPIQYFCTHC